MKTTKLLAILTFLLTTACGANAHAQAPAASQSPPFGQDYPLVPPALVDWYGFQSPSGESYLQLRSEWLFTPYNPGYIPNGFHHTSTLTAGQVGTQTFGLRYTAENGRDFIALLQSVAPRDGSLPGGKPVQVGSCPAVLQTGGNIDLQDDPEGKREWLKDYLFWPGVQRLTWNAGGVQFDLIGTLPETELYRIANSLEPAEPGTGELKPPAKH